MFKKNAWVAGLLAALVIVLAGCVDALPPPEGEIVEVTRLSEIIKDAPVGVIKDDAAWSAIFADTPFMKCGPSTFEIIDDGGVKKLKVYKMINTWGEGLDVRHAPTADGNSGANYKVGDEVYIKGTADPEGIFINAKGGAYAKVDNWTSGATFEKTVTLTADDVGNIQTGSPQTLRLTYDDGKGDSRRGTIIFEEILVKGMRSAGDKIELPDFSVDNAGAYNVGILKPAANEVYLDLAETVKFNLTPDPKKFVAYVEKGKTAGESGALYAKFTVNTQGLFIAFTDEVKAKLQTALRDGYTLSYAIDGSADSANSNVRIFFGQDAGGNWNATGDLGGNDFNSASVLKKDKIDSFGQNGGVDIVNGMIIQARPLGNNETNPITAPYTIRINSIKITLNLPSKVISALNFGLKVPAGGATAPTSTSGTGWTGTITWTPPLPPNGKWGLSTVYYATITFSPLPDYYIKSDATVSINSPPLTLAKAYDPVSKTVSTASFPATDSTPVPLPAFTLSTDAGFQALADGASLASYGNWDDLTGDGALRGNGGTYSVAVVDGKKVVKHQVGGQYQGVHLVDDYFGFEPGDVLKVVVNITAITGTSAELVNVIFNADPNGWAPLSPTYDIPNTTAGINAEIGKDITIEKTLTAANIASINGSSANPKAIRFLINNGTSGTEYIIKEISVTGNGRVAP